MRPKLVDCITYFQEKVQADLRINILMNVVDKFVICESIFDHRGNKKEINFEFEKYKKLGKKIEHIILKEPFPSKNIPWENQALQREYIFEGIKEENENDLIMFSDPDEIPNPKVFRNFSLNKKYGIFMQKMFTYKLNYFNKYESPWEGTRICKKKDLKSIDWLRQKVLKKNLNYPFWRFNKEKNIQIIENGGWHFNYLLKPEEIAKKLKSLAETKWDKKEFYDLEIIKQKISNRIDLFGRGHKFEKVNIDHNFPEYIVKNRNLFSEWID